jgi:hypothetical protein
LDGIPEGTAIFPTTPEFKARLREMEKKFKKEEQERKK